MVGLSVVLEAQRSSCFSKKPPQVINKTTMVLSNNKSSPSATSSSSFLFDLNSGNSSSYTPTFLDKCFLCRKCLLPGKDIYMYKGDRAFCSVDCRCKQIFMDEEEIIHKENCALAAMRPTSTSSSSSSSTGRNNHRNGARNRAGGFVY